MISALKEINEKLLIANKNNKEELQKQSLIHNILQEENCFFKMDIETAYQILRDLKIPEDKIKSVYIDIMSNYN